MYDPDDNQGPEPPEDAGNTNIVTPQEAEENPEPGPDDLTEPSTTTPQDIPLVTPDSGVSPDASNSVEGGQFIVNGALVNAHGESITSGYHGNPDPSWE